MTDRLIRITTALVVLDASRQNHPVPRLALWSLGAGIVATVGANVAHGLGHGPIGALVSAWPALALVGSFELLMMLIRSGQRGDAEHSVGTVENHDAPTLVHEPRAVLSLEQTVREQYSAGHSQRAIARDLCIDRRKVKRIIDRNAV